MSSCRFFFGLFSSRRLLRGKLVFVKIRYVEDGDFWSSLFLLLCYFFYFMFHFVDVERLYPTANEWNVERLFLCLFLVFYFPGLKCDENSCRLATWNKGIFWSSLFFRFFSSKFTLLTWNGGGVRSKQVI
jgi:hypothetical protein